MLIDERKVRRKLREFEFAAAKKYQAKKQEIGL